MKVASNVPTLAPAVRNSQPAAPAEAPPTDRYVSSEGQKSSFPLGKIVKIAAVAAVTGVIGQAAGNVGGIAGGFIGGVVGVGTGMFAIGQFGNGKGGEGLIYPIAGAAIGGLGGAILGAIGGGHGMAVGAAAGAAAAAAAFR